MQLAVATDGTAGADAMVAHSRFVGLQAGGNRPIGALRQPHANDRKKTFTLAHYHLTARELIWCQCGRVMSGR